MSISKLKEALENSNGLLEELALIGEWSEAAKEQIAENKAALAEPLRNYEVGTDEEQSKRFKKYCAIHKSFEWGCEKCPIFPYKIIKCEFIWAQLPYEPVKTNKTKTNKGE